MNCIPVSRPRVTTSELVTGTESPVASISCILICLKYIDSTFQKTNTSWFQLFIRRTDRAVIAIAVIGRRYLLLPSKRSYLVCPCTLSYSVGKSIGMISSTIIVRRETFQLDFKCAFLRTIIGSMCTTKMPRYELRP